MKPNNSGGRIFQNEEVPVVVGAIYRHDEEFGKRCRDWANRFEEQRQINVTKHEMFSVLHGPLPDCYKDERRISLDPIATNKALGHLLESYDDKVLFPDEVPIARRILLEMGLIEPNLKEKILNLGKSAIGIN